MKKLSIKIISIVLTVCLLMGVVPMSIFAEENKNNVYVDVTLKADKTDYTDGDIIAFNGSIVNTSLKDCNADIDIGLYATPSIKLDTKTLKVNALSAGESHDFCVEATANRTRFGFALIQAAYDIITGYVYTIVLELVSLFSSNYECIRVYIDKVPAAVMYKVDSSVIIDDDSKEKNDEIYIVSFDVNGNDVQNIPEVQKVLKGECAIEPEIPLRDGYVFDGWFCDKDLTTKFSFDSSIVSDMTLYAKWNNGSPDDAKDEVDEDVAPDDVYTLSADKTEILAGSTTDMYFYVNSTLTVSYFELYLNGVNTGIKLYDDGQYNSHYDDIPNDGCYSGMYTVNADEETTLYFKSKASVGETTVETNEISIFCYYEITDEESDEMDFVNSNIQKIISDIKSENSSCNESELKKLLHDGIKQYCDSLVNQGVICNVYYDTANCVISFQYTKTGVLGAVQYYSYKDNVKWSGGNEFSNSVNSLRPNEDTMLSSNSISSQSEIDIDYITYKEKALLLCYESNSSGWNGASQEDSTNNLATLLEDGGFDVTTKFSATVNDYKDMQKYAFIDVSAHGSYYTHWTGPFSNEKTPVICTSESSTKANRKTYSADLKAGRIVDCGEYWIRPSFFSHYESDPLNARIVSLGCCKGGQSDELADAIIDAGANTVLAYSDTVYTAYNYQMMEDIVEDLLNGESISTSVQNAKNENGDNDIIWGTAQRDSGNHNFDTLKSETATMRILGNSTTKIHHSLQNGNFDNVFGLMNNNVYKWEEYGDARSIYKLSGISPKSSPKMAIISSGFGSQNSETTSCLYQVILVPENAKSIKINYDVVSEEPMEYVGTKYNDIFQIDILSTDGDLLDTIAYESVNTSTWYAVDGIDFPGGDETTYHTRWTQVESDAISNYNGQLIVLRFTVKDAGDSIYDTAALIDSITIE